MTHKRTSGIIGSALLLAAAHTAVGSEVLYSNFGPGDSYVGNAGATLAYGGPLAGEHHEAAVGFTVSGGDFSFTSAEVGVGHLFGPNLLHIRLHADDDGAPGDVLEAVDVLDQMGPLSTDPEDFNPPIVAEFSGETVLEDGTQYWLSISSDTSTDSWAAWNQNNIGDFGLRASRVDGGPWNVFDGGPPPRATFRINGTPATTTGDLTGDGTVGVDDLLILLAEWGLCADCAACPADLTGDCTVGVDDLLILLANWG